MRDKLLCVPIVGVAGVDVPGAARVLVKGKGPSSKSWAVLSSGGAWVRVALQSLPYGRGPASSMSADEIAVVIKLLRDFGRGDLLVEAAHAETPSRVCPPRRPS